MQYTTLALALAASAAAAPYTTPYMGVALTPPPTCEQFTLIFMVDGQGVSANAVTNGTGGPMVLQGGRPAAYPGTPAYFNSSDPFPEPGFTFKALNFILPDAVYGAVAPNIGDDQGVADNIWLEKDTEQFEWVEYNGTISHKLYAAPNGIYACKDHLVTGEENFFLRFGDYNFTGNGSPPANCNTTTVYINYNIPGGLQPSS